MSHPDFVEPLALIKHGMDTDLAFAMPRHMRRAALIAFGQLDGGEWDWDMMGWRERT